MKILLITDKFIPDIGGTQIIFHNLCLNFRNYKAVALTRRCRGWRRFDSGQSYRIYRVPFLNIPKLRGFLLYLSLLLAAPFIIIKERPDIIHCGQLLETGFIGFLMKKIFRIPFVIHTVGEEITKYTKFKILKFLSRAILNYADGITSISEFTKKEVMKLGVPGNKITVVYPGVDLKAFSLDTDHSEIAEKYGLKDKKVLLTVARVIERKGCDMVIRALPEIRKRIPNIKYLIHEPAQHQIIEKLLKPLVRKLALEDIVIFTDSLPIEDISPYYTACDVFIMPNRFVEKTRDVEGFGLVFLEANACGKPVIGGRSGGVPEAVIDGETGLLVNPTDINEIIHAVVTLLSDEDYSKRLGAFGRRRVEKEFSWEHYVRKLEILNMNLAADKLKH